MNLLSRCGCLQATLPAAGMDSHKHTLAHTESSGVHPTVESEQQIPHIENVFKDYKYKNTTVSQIASCVINHKERTHSCIRQHDNLGKWVRVFWDCLLTHNMLVAEEM